MKLIIDNEYLNVCLDCDNFDDGGYDLWYTRRNVYCENFKVNTIVWDDCNEDACCGRKFYVYWLQRSEVLYTMKLIVNGQELRILRSNTRKYRVILDDCLVIRYCTNLCEKDKYYCSRYTTLNKIIIQINMYTGEDHYCYCCTKFRSSII